MKTKIALFDIDGTLIAHGRTAVPVSAAAAISRLQQEGFVTAVASGRIFPQIQPCIKELNFDYYVCANGHIVTDSQGQVIADHPLPADFVTSLTAYCRKHHYPLGIKYADRIVVASQYQSSLKAIFVNLVATGQNAILHNGASFSLTRLLAKPAYNALVAIADDKLAAAQAALPQIRFDRIKADLYNAGLYSVTKADGVDLLLNHLKLTWPQAIIFGDAENDVTMIARAGTGVAMANADVKAKKAAGYITGSCNENGIEQALRHFGLL